jgi:ClpP class serine protease
VVAGLNESVRKLRRCALDAGIPLKAYVDEMAASAAYAIACACDEIVCPRSAILGSVGVISTMVDQTAADEEAGLRFVTITSGNRKADGHPHVPIEDDAVAAERSRVMTLAGEFFQLVSESRELSVDQIRGFQAGIFLGRAARKAGLADAVMGWDAYLEKLGLDNGKPSKSPSPVSPTRQPALGDAKMNKQIDRLKAQIAKEKDPAKLAALATQLAGYKKTEKHVEHVKTEEEDDEEESEESEEAKGNETDRSDEPEDDEEKDDEEEDDEESEESEKKSTKKSSKKSEEQEEAKAMRAVYKAACQATGKSGKRVAGALAALLAEAREMPALRSRVARIEKNERKAKREGMVESAKAQRRITPHEAKVLASKSLEFVTDYLAMRPNAIVSGHDDELLVPSGKEHADLPSSAMQEIDRAVAAQYPDGAAPEKRELFKAKLVENARKAIAEMNGAAVGRH